MAKDRSGDSAELAEAAALFVAGDYDGARAVLETIDAAELSDDERVSYYLYLGRSRMALGDYSAASSAFLLGRQYGDVERFDAYLVEVNEQLRGGANTVAPGDGVTRAQLARQLGELLAERLDGRKSELPADVAQHWSREFVGPVMAAGWMSVLPDGNFHPEAYVTRASFAVTLVRLRVPGAGFADAVFRMTGEGEMHVSASETAGVLREIASAAQ